MLSGNIGRAIMKTSAVRPELQRIEAPAKVFHGQGAVKEAFRRGELDCDAVIVVRFQGPKSNGMPELHALTPMLSVLIDKGFRVVLATDGRMSGASGKVPSAIHISPEAAEGGTIAKIRDGDLLRVDGINGILDALADGIEDREPADPPPPAAGLGRELFAAFRTNVGSAAEGAAVAV